MEKKRKEGERSGERDPNERVDYVTQASSCVTGVSGDSTEVDCLSTKIMAITNTSSQTNILSRVMPDNS